jgi:hypothetical protein
MTPHIIVVEITCFALGSAGLLTYLAFRYLMRRWGR